MRIVIVVTAALLVLAGCGGKDAGSADTGVGDTDVATGGRLFKTADEDTAKLALDFDVNDWLTGEARAG